MILSLVVGLVVLWGVWTGATRMVSRSFRPLLIGLAALLAGAGACWLIGSQKTGGGYHGLLSMLLVLLLLLAAGSVILGAALRGLHDLTRRRLTTDLAAPPAGNWDIWGLCALSATAVIASVAE